MVGEAQGPTQRRAGRAAWGVAVALIVVLIGLLVISLATGGGDDSSSNRGGGYTTFGQEASAADRDAAAATVQSFLRARADDDFAKQCSLMAQSTKRTLEGFGGGLSQKHLACPQLIESVGSQIKAKAIRGSDRIQVTGVRVDGDRGFVIYRSGGETSAFAVIREGSAWKVGAIAGYPVPNA